MDVLKRISHLDPEKKKLLDLKIKQKNVDIFKIPITGEYRKNAPHCPLSFEQEPMWFLEQMDPNNTTYDVLGAIELQGDLNKRAFEKSINEIVKRHEILRTVFITDNDKAVQVILPSLTLDLKVMDLKDLPVEKKKHRLEYLRDDKSIRFFDINKGPLVEILLIELTGDHYIFLVIMHHLLSDLISLEIFFQELASYYWLYTQGSAQEIRLPAVSCQYADYACWQRHWFQESIIGIEARKKQEKFWLDQYQDEVPVLNLPIDYPRPAVKRHDAAQVFFTLKGEEVKNLKELVLKENTTLYMALLSVLYVFLARISGQEDIVIGTPVSSRRQASVQKLVGLFSRTLALRDYPRGDKTFKDFLLEVNTHTLDAYTNQEYQYEELVGKLLAARDSSRNPLFDVMFNFISINTNTINMPGLKIQPFRCKSRSTAFDIELTVEGKPGELFFKLSYSTLLFKEETIARFISYLIKIIGAVGKNPEVPISAVEIMPAEEKKRVLFNFNNTKKPLIQDKSYVRLVEEQAARSADKIAAVYHDHYATYSQLNEEANSIAGILFQKGAALDSIIALYLERSIKILAAIIGVFKTGAAYLPLDLDYPGKRISYMLNDSKAQVLLIDNPTCPSWLSSLPGALLNLSQGDHFDTLTNVLPSFHPSMSNSLAYLIYTSGTTGKPKGVMIHHQGMLNHLYAKINDLSITGDDITAQTAPAVFDISVWQFLAGLLVGGRTVIVDKETLLDSPAFFGVLQRNRITILEFVPSLMMAFLETAWQEYDNLLQYEPLKHLRWMVSTGEPLTPQLVNQWYRHYPHITLVNAYGPTEASDDITHYIVPGNAEENQITIPIGKPLQNLHVYVLDKYLSLCPIGVRGEICVAGIGVGIGYLNNPELTAEKFNRAAIGHSSLVIGSDERFTDTRCPMTNDRSTNDRFHSTTHHSPHHHSPLTTSPVHRSLLYRTGDLGYFRTDGNIECLGRLDSQVKIRGNRIELGEIENQLLGHQSIKEAVVTVRTAPGTGNTRDSADSYLCAYIVPQREISLPELKSYLEGKLPDYMMPSYFTPLEKLPLTPNGKIDRSALPEPSYESYETGKKYIAPGTEIEAGMVDIWSELLRIEKDIISIDANFFELGGHSLNATAIVSKIRQVFNVSIPLAEVFKSPSIRALSAYVQKLT